MPYYGVSGSTKAMKVGSLAWIIATRAQQMETILAQVCDGDMTVADAARAYRVLATDSANY